MTALTRHTTFRLALDPTPRQARDFRRYAGSARHVYNQGLEIVKLALDCRSQEVAAGAAPTTNVPWTRNGLIPAFNRWWPTHSPWLAEQSKFVREEALEDLAAALQAFSRARRGGERAAFPEFKRKHRVVPSFRLRQTSSANGVTSGIRFDGRGIVLPKLGRAPLAGGPRRVRRMIEKGRFRVLSVTISYRQGRWWASVTGLAAEFHPDRQRLTKQRQPRNPVAVGVDLGVRTLAVIVDENGAVVEQREGVKALQAAQRKLRRANRALSRTKIGSRGRANARRRLARVHARVTNLRDNELHQVTTGLATGHDRVVVEDLNVAGMLQNRSVARGVSGQAFAEVRRRLAYKAAWYGCELVVADRWYPSSKTCSACSRVNRGLARGAVSWTCPWCGVVLDRDVNAAVNLARWRPSQPETAPG